MFRKNTHSAAPSTPPPQSAAHEWDTYFDVEAHLAEPFIPGPPSTSNASMQPADDSDSDSSFDRFLEEEQTALANGVKKKVIKKKQKTVRRKVPSRAARAVSSPEELSSPSENEFDTFIRSLGSLPGAEAEEQSSVGAKRRARTDHTQTSAAVAAGSQQADPPVPQQADPPVPPPAVRPRTTRFQRVQRRRSVRSLDNPAGSSDRGTSIHNDTSHSRGAAHTGRLFLGVPACSHPAVRASAAAASAAAATASEPSVIDISDDDDGLDGLMNLSPHTISNHHLAEDEVFARNLQEEMDREYAAHLAGQRTPEIPHPPAMPGPAAVLPPPIAIVTDPVASVVNVNPASARGRRGARGARARAVHTSPGRDASQTWRTLIPQASQHELAHANHLIRVIQRGASVTSANRNRVPTALPNPWLGINVRQRAEVPLQRYEDLIRLQDRLGDVAPRGISDSQLDMLPTKVLRLSPSDPVTECTICCEDYVNKDLIKILTCFHEYHDHCISAWLKNNKTCPICRVEIRLE